MGAARFTDLAVWQKSYRLALSVYNLTRKFPVEERYCLAIQMRRAAISVPANIAEGFSRRGPRDQAHFYTIAKSSAEELKVFLMMTKDLAYCADVIQPQTLVDEVCAMLYVLRERVLSGRTGV